MGDATDLKWEYNQKKGIYYGVLTLNGAIMYEIMMDDGDTYDVWLTPEGDEDARYLWRFYLLSDAKRYVEQREAKNRSSFINSSASPNIEIETTYLSNS